jgi:hypothetical protein
METEGVEKGKGKKTEQVDNFLQEIASICRKHGFSISHEDTQGAFVIEAYDETYNDWLMAASVGKSVRPA